MAATRNVAKIENYDCIQKRGMRRITSGFTTNSKSQKNCAFIGIHHPKILILLTFPSILRRGGRHILSIECKKIMDSAKIHDFDHRIHDFDDLNDTILIRITLSQGNRWISHLYQN